MAISLTHKCTAKCLNCCFSCSPDVEYSMDFETAKKHIENALTEYPSIQVVSFTGGEVFLQYGSLVDLISLVSSKNRISRVVSNAYWAKSYNIAYEKLRLLKNAGLKEINFSTGDEHQVFVKFDNIVNAIKASYDVGIKSIALVIEGKSNAIFREDDVLNNANLAPIVHDNKLFVFTEEWIEMSKNCEIEKKDKAIVIKNSLSGSGPCENIFKTISINPYSQLLSCCGLTVEYNKFLKLGNLQKNSLKSLYESQFHDLYKIWLYVDGPKFIYNMLMKYMNFKPKIYNHECQYCIETISTLDKINSLKLLVDKNKDSILFKLKLKTHNYEKGK